MIAAVLYGVSAGICISGIGVTVSRHMPALTGFLIALALLLTRLAIRNLALAGHDIGSAAALLEGRYSAITAGLFTASLLYVAVEYLELGRRT